MWKILDVFCKFGGGVEFAILFDDAVGLATKGERARNAARFGIDQRQGERLFDRYDLEIVMLVKLAVAFEHNAHADLVIDGQSEFRAA